MKNKNFFPNSERVSGIVVLLVAALAIGSCSKDPDVDLVPSSNPVRFCISDSARSQSWSAETVRTDNAVCDVFALEGDAPDCALFLHAGISDTEDNATLFAHSTRAAQVGDLSAYGSFGVSSYTYKTADGWSETLTPSPMYDIEVREESTGVWAPVTECYWPGSSRKIRFFAYAPYNVSGATLSAATAAGTPTIAYTVPTTVADQKDLLIADSGELAGDGSDGASLAFRHALTAIRFAVGDDMMAGKITKITLKGVYGQGVCSLNDSSWSAQSTAATYTQTIDFSVDSTSGTSGTAITDPNQIFFVIPQTLPSGASIEIAFTDKLTGTARTLKADIFNKTWEPGKTVTYSISTNSIVITPTFTVTAPADIPYSGGSQTYKVQSSATISRQGDPSKTQAMAWTTEFYDYNETSKAYDIKLSGKPAWLTAFTESGAGATSAQSFTATAAAQSGSTENSHTAALQNAAARGSEASPYDLSSYTVDNQPQSGMTTANCYVVSAPGWYKLPLVYGNAVKGGQTNSDSYNPAGTSGANFLKPFVKHDNAAITAPCLADNSGVVPASAELLWNDTGIETYIKVSPMLSTYTAAIDGSSRTLQYLVFNVPQESICQGNAVVAVKNQSGTILWSWHIWITDENITATKSVTNFMNEKNRLMPVNLGHCDGLTTTYPKRSVKVVFTQTESKAERSFVLTQSEGKVSSGGNSPYFQWGRKDAFLPSNGTGNTDKTFFGTKWTYSSAAATIGMNIQNPTVHYNTSSRPATCQAYNLWSAVNTKNNVQQNVKDEPVIKTVYDPCPPGFHVAPTNAFTGFSTTGTNTSNATQFNVKGSWDTGWHFYCDKNKGTGNGTIFFPASGCRLSSSGALYGVGGYGYYWAAVPYSTSFGRHLYFLSGYVRPLSINTRSHGFPVRPAQE